MPIFTKNGQEMGTECAISVSLMHRNLGTDWEHDMASFSQLPSGSWRVQVRRKGIDRTATFQSKPEARKWAAEIEAQVRVVAAGGHAPLPSATTVSQLVDLYNESGITDKQGRTKRASLAMLRREIGNVKVSQLSAITLRDLIDRRQKQGAGGVTIAADLSFLSSVMKWAKHVRHLDVPERLALDARASLKHRKLNTRSTERDRLPTPAELDKLFHHWEVQALKLGMMNRDMTPMRELVEFAIASAMRISEVCRITCEDVDEEKRSVWIRDRKDPSEKVGNDQLVPLLGPAWTMVEAALHERRSGFLFPYNAGSVSTLFTRAVKACKIKNLRLHDMRHEGITRLFKAGLQIPQVMKISGHKDPKMLMRYLNLSTEDVHAAYDRHNPCPTAPAVVPAETSAPAARPRRLRLVEAAA
ncbi:site-specific integrase [Variovorax sp. J22P240]|uniref:tyrosine-type recombinase/integrase n=1 Tax=Variovorax sp. J22P240 TaxID=3053514 RepID=UPI0025768E55|nr:site-specific integrase [Variovorax sp. J22P240]MDL9997258.1 site-specific integrase [Variovorax sp. J22P240]